MQHTPLAPLAGAFALMVTAILGALEAIPGIAFVWQFVGVFGFIGTVIAYRRRQNDPDFEPFPIIVRWSAVGLGLGLLILGFDQLG